MGNNAVHTCESFIVIYNYNLKYKCFKFACGVFCFMYVIIYENKLFIMSLFSN